MNSTTQPQRMEHPFIKFEGTEFSLPLLGGHRFAPVKTICELIDVRYDTQVNWLKKHPFFSQLGGLYPMVGADGKERMMYALPMIDAYSWLAGISPKQRREGSEQKQLAFMTWFRELMLKEYQVVHIIERSLESERELLRLNEMEQAEIKQIEADLRRRKQVIKQRTERVEAIRHNRVTGQIEMELLEAPE